jgi:hypothetical protein
MDRWVFVLGVFLVCCLLCPPFLGVLIGVGFYSGVALVAYKVLGGFMR